MKIMIRIMKIMKTIKYKVKNKFKTISSYLDISKLYFIPIEIFKKSSLIIFFILAISLFAAFIIILKCKVDLSNYYSIWSILPPLFMVYLMWKNKYNFIKLSIRSVYMISNLGLLSFILSLVIYFASNYLFYAIYPISYQESFKLSRSIIGFFLSLKITIFIIEKFCSFWKEPKKLCEELFKLIRQVESNFWSIF